MLGRYELVSKLGVGGMAEIYLARATGIAGFEKRVVIKKISPALAGQGDFVTMFLDEARLAARLQHGNVAQIYDVGEQDGAYFIAMEYVPGKDLRHVRKRLYALNEQMLHEHAIGVVLGVAAGLHAAHEARDERGVPLQIVHRDVSPANIMVTFDGCVKLIDFGIAKAAQRQTETRTGVLKGKYSFMSPEQILGREVDRRSDVFGLGLVLFELTTGTPVWSGLNEHEIMRRVAGGRMPRPSHRMEQYPAELEAIVMRALARNADDRYQSAQELYAHLEFYAREHQLPVSPLGLGNYIRALFPEPAPQQASERASTTKAPMKLPLRATTEDPDLSRIIMKALLLGPAGRADSGRHSITPDVGIPVSSEELQATIERAPAECAPATSSGAQRARSGRAGSRRGSSPSDVGRRRSAQRAGSARAGSARGSEQCEVVIDEQPVHGTQRELREPSTRFVSSEPTAVLSSEPARDSSAGSQWLAAVLTAVALGVLLALGWSYLAVAKEPGRTRSARRAVPVTAAATAPSGTQELPEGIIVGQVLRGGEPEAGILVELSSTARLQRSSTDEQGRFRFERIPLDLYRIATQEGEHWRHARQAPCGGLAGGETCDIGTLEIGDSPVSAPLDQLSAISSVEPQPSPLPAQGVGGAP